MATDPADAKSQQSPPPQRDHGHQDERMVDAPPEPASVLSAPLQLSFNPLQQPKEAELTLSASSQSTHRQQDQPQQQQPPSSPPLPPKPVSLAPGPRASRFEEVFQDRLKKSLAKISYNNFASCYPTIAAANSAVLQVVQKQMIERLGQLCRKEFSNVVAVREVVAKLNELEGLVDDAARRREEAETNSMGDDGGEVKTPVAPHLLSPERVLLAHLAPYLATQQVALNAKLQTMQSRNAALYAMIEAQRAEIETLLQTVERSLADVRAANDLLDEVANEVAEETKMVEVEMTGGLHD